MSRRPVLTGHLLLIAAAAGLALCARPAAVCAQGVPRIAFEKVVLANGLEVILHEDHSVPLVSVNVWYKVGSGDEKVGRTGFAHLFEHLMFMGSENVPVGKFDQWLEAAGGNNNGSTTSDRTNYYEWMPSNALPLALWLEADRMGRLLPTMDLPKVDLQRDVVKNERRQSYDNQPYGRASETMLAAMYPAGHPYSWPTIGSLADLNAAKLEDVKDFFRTYYAPNNASLVIAGDFAPDSAKALVQQLFGAIPRGPQLPPRPQPAMAALARDTFLVLEDKVQLPRVYLSWHTVKEFAPDDAALDLLASVLTGGKGSRLQKRFLFDKQLAQDVGASQRSSRLAGTFMVSVTVRPGESPTALEAAVRDEISTIAATGVSERELTRAKNGYRARFLNQLASVNSKADVLNAYNYAVGTPDYVQQDAARYDAVTVADLQRVAREYLARPRLVLTVVPTGKPALMVTGRAQ